MGGTPTDTPHPEVLAGRYELVSEVGKGGMATVYRARDLRHGGEVAVKVMRREVTSLLGGERFQREIRLTARLQHPNILAVLDTGEADGVPFYVMPLVDGESLHDRLIRERQLPLEEAIRLAGEVADALSHAHAQGVVHRDIKPSNILLSHGHAMVADFGIARALDTAATERLTDSGLALGTAHYMSPEQASTGTVDGRSDLYSLACVLYEMLAGSPPFSGPSAQTVMARHAVDPVPSLRTARMTVSPALEAAIVRGLSKVPADRYPDANEFKEAIQRAALDMSRPVPRRSLVRQRAAIAVGMVFVAAVAWQLTRPGTDPLDPNRVMVFPLSTTGVMGASPSLGEDVATVIGSAVDGAGPLRWVDGWPLLTAVQRDTIKLLSTAQARRLAVSRRCAFMISGQLIKLGDSTEARLELHDVRTDSSTSSKAIGAGSEPWRIALRAVNELMPRLVAADRPDPASGLEERSPAAMAGFLLGESAFRRVQFEEALARFREAVRADSTFALAALRGAQAATWSHRTEEAAALVQIAARGSLPPRYMHMAAAYQAYLEGRADSSIASLRSALSIDPDMAVAWAQLGEVYTHLLPRAGNPDSIADDAFARAIAIDSTSAYLLYHPIQIALRHGLLQRAEPMMRRFVAADPDTTLRRHVEIMAECVRRGAGGGGVAWTDLARSRPFPLLNASFSLGAGGHNLPCAIAGFRAILAVDTSSEAAADGRRWSALIGLNGALLTQGRSAAAAAAIDSFSTRWRYGTSLFLLSGPNDSLMSRRAREIFAGDSARFAPTFELMPAFRVWETAQWLLQVGALDAVVAFQRDLEARATKSQRARDSLLARSLAARIALVRGDTVGAFSLLRDIVPAAMSSALTQWDEMAPVPGERLLLAQLLLARGDPAGAAAVAEMIDSPAASIHLLYLPASLALRQEAATLRADERLRAALHRRIQGLGRE